MLIAGLVLVHKGIENVRFGHCGEGLFTVYLRKGLITHSLTFK